MAEHLRSGLYREFGVAAQQIAEAALGRQERRAGSYKNAIERIEAARSLLDEVGWDADRSPVRVDMAKRRDLVLRVFRQQLNDEVDALRDCSPRERPKAERVVAELGDYALYLQSLHL